MSNVQTALQFFQSRGWSPAQAAGIVGNLMQESGRDLNTSAVGDGGAAFGIAQHNGPRKRALFSFAKMHGKDPSDLGIQLQFIDHELRTSEKSAAAALRRAQTPADAARVFSDKFERPGIPHMERRISYAQILAGGHADGPAQPTQQFDLSASVGADTLVGGSGADTLEDDTAAALRALEGSDQSLDPDTEKALAAMNEEPSMSERIGGAIRGHFEGIAEGIADTPRAFVESATRATAGMANEFASGLQQVDPSAVDLGNAIGEIRDGKVFDYAFSGQGELFDPKLYDQSKFFTQIAPDGRELVFERSAETAETSPILNAGRVLTMGAVNSIPLGSTGRAAQNLPKASGPAAQAAQAAQRLKVTPSLGTHGAAPGAAASVLESSMITGAPIRRDIHRAAGEMQGARERIADTAGQSADRVQAGDALRTGADNFVTRQIKGAKGRPSVSDKLLSKVEEFVPPTTQINMSGTTNRLRGIVGQFENLPQVSSDLSVNKWKKWIEDLDANGGVLTWHQARQLRTFIGSQVGKISGPLANRAEGELKQLYGALSDDLKRATEAVSPEAAMAWQRYNKHYERSRRLIDESLDIILRSDTHPEQAYERFLSLGLGKGQQANLRKLADVKRAMPADAWGEVMSVVIRRMGQSGDGFSPAKFVTDWERLSPQAKALMFSGAKTPRGLRQELNDLVAVATASKGADRLINHSRSGSLALNTATGVTAGTAMAGDVVTAGLATLGLASARGVVEAFASPTFVKAFRNYVASGGTPGAAKSVFNVIRQDPKLAAILIEANAARTSAPGSPRQAPIEAQ